MIIERTLKNRLTITVSAKLDSYGLQRLFDYVKYLEISSGNKVKQTEADRMADKVNASWWKKNKTRFLR